MNQEEINKIAIKLRASQEARYDYISNVQYFWQEKGEIERFSSFNRDIMQEFFPDVIRRIDNYQDAEMLLCKELSDESINKYK